MSTVLEQPLMQPSPQQPPVRKRPRTWLILAISALIVVIAAIIAAVMLTGGGGTGKPGLSNVASHNGISAVVTGQRITNSDDLVTLKVTNSTGATMRNVAVGIKCVEKGSGTITVTGTIHVHSAVKPGVNFEHFTVPLLMQATKSVTGWHLRIVSP